MRNLQLSVRDSTYHNLSKEANNRDSTIEELAQKLLREHTDSQSTITDKEVEQQLEVVSKEFNNAMYQLEQNLVDRGKGYDY